MILSIHGRIVVDLEPRGVIMTQTSYGLHGRGSHIPISGESIKTVLENMFEESTNWGEEYPGVLRFKYRDLEYQLDIVMGILTWRIPSKTYRIGSKETYSNHIKSFLSRLDIIECPYQFGNRVLEASDHYEELSPKVRDTSVPRDIDFMEYIIWDKITPKSAMVDYGDQLIILNEWTTYIGDKSYKSVRCNIRQPFSLIKSLDINKVREKIHNLKQYLQS